MKPKFYIFLFAVLFFSNSVLAQSEDHANIFPNPNPGNKVTIVANLQTESQLTVTNIIGATLFSMTLPKGESKTEIDITPFADKCQQVYFVNIQSIGAFRIWRQ